MSEPTPNDLNQSTARIIALRDAGVLSDPFGVRVFAALGRVANAIIVPANGYNEPERSQAKAMYASHTQMVAWAEAITASILAEDSAPFWEPLPDADLENLVTIFVRRYFGLPDQPEVTL